MFGPSVGAGFSFLRPPASCQKLYKVRSAPTNVQLL
jgi:hypothetical protein